MPIRAFGEKIAWVLLRVVVAVLRHVPVRALRWAGACLGDILYCLTGSRRRIALRNLDTAYGDRLAPREKRRIARRCAGTFFESVLVLFGLYWREERTRDRWIDAGAIDTVRTLLDEGHGVIIVSGHLSNFPLAMCDLALRGIPLAVVVRAKGFGPTEKMSQIIREESGIETIARQATALRTGKWLQQGGVVWLTIDQNAPDGVLVDFFGKPATTFTLAVRMARATGAPILPLFVHTKEDATYVLEVEEPIRLPRGKPGPGELVNELRQLNVLLEKHILQSPDQWLWSHSRWKTADRMAQQQTAKS